MMPLIPENCFWMVDGNDMRVAKYNSHVKDGTMYTIYRNDVDAWKDDAMDIRLCDIANAAPVIIH